MELIQLFEKPRYVWVLEYGITHSAMRLAVHDGNFPRYTEVVCRDCSYFSGALQGGPYSMTIQTSDRGEVRFKGDKFELVCGQAEVGRSRQ